VKNRGQKARLLEARSWQAQESSVATKENAKPGVFTRKNLLDPEIFSLGAGRFGAAHREIFEL
jgi:hypothetical protein